MSFLIVLLRLGQGKSKDDLRVCWLLVLRQAFVGLMYFMGDDLRISRHMEVLRMLTLREFGVS